MNIQLPFHEKLPVPLLSSCFKSTTASYKYYWLLSIIQIVEAGESKIPKKNIFATMIANAWYPVNYYRLSFGKQDQIARAVESIKILEKVSVESTPSMVAKIIIESEQSETQDILNYFNTNVPHWFLSPWFPRKSKSEIYSLSKLNEVGALYSLYDDYIEIHDDWIEYIRINSRLIKDFVLWNLVLYLQKHNPNTPDLPWKLKRAAKRQSLTKQKTDYWDLVIKELGSVDCIYTKKKLQLNRYELDHYVPYSFVAHNLIWNLIPADPSFNSIKGDNLPPTARYFNSFYTLQRIALQIMLKKYPRNPYIDEYFIIFRKSLSQTDLLGSFTETEFLNTVQPLINIASNNGFTFF